MRKLQNTKPIRHALIWSGIHRLEIPKENRLGELLQFSEENAVCSLRTV
jgi:hypothetical protein